MTWPKVRDLRWALAEAARRFADWIQPVDTEPQLIEVEIGETGNPSAILHVPGTLSREQVTEIVERLRSSAGKPARWLDHGEVGGASRGA